MLLYVIRCPNNASRFPWILPLDLALRIDGETPVDQLREYIGAMWRVDPACVSFYIGDEVDGINSSTVAGKRLADLPAPTRDDGQLYVTARLNATAQWSTRTFHMRDVVRQNDDDDEHYHVVQHYVDPTQCWACGKSIEDTSGSLELLCGHTHCGACADAIERDAANAPVIQGAAQRGFVNDPAFYCCRYCMLPTLARGLQRARSTPHLDAHKDGRLCNVRNCGSIATRACWCETVFCDRHAREHSDRLIDHTTAPLAERGPGAFVPGLCLAEHGGRGDRGDSVACKGRLRYYCMTYHEAMCAHCGYTEKHASCGAGCHVRLDDPRAVADREAHAHRAWAALHASVTYEERPTEKDSSAAALVRLVTYRDRLVKDAASVIAAVQEGPRQRPYTNDAPWHWAVCHGNTALAGIDHSLCVRFVAFCTQEGVTGALRQAAKGRHACCVGMTLSLETCDFDWASVWGKHLTDASLREVAAHCPQLQHLNVAGCTQLTNASLVEVAMCCPLLQHLNVSECTQLTDASLRELATHCPQLQHLNVSGCKQLTDASIRQVATRCPQLQLLNVSWCKQLTVTDAALREVAAHCPLLHHLDISECNQLTDASLREVAAHCPQLQHLNVSGCKQLTDASIREVATRCPQLQHLNVWGCQQTTDVALREVATHCPQLQHLGVSWCPCLTDASMREVATHCPQLQHWGVWGCQQLAAASLREVATHCSQMQHLNVSWCPWLTEVSLREVAMHCPKLRHLNVSGCKQLTDEALCEVAAHCPQLQRLDVSGCKLLTDASIREVATHCPQLQHLDVSWCPWLTDASMRDVSTHCPLLHHLDVSRCTQLTDASLLNVAKQYPHIDIRDGFRRRDRRLVA